MAQRYFITSTGTGIGKTYVTAALIRQAKALGLTVAATKPVISGFDKREIAASDTGAILAALGEDLSPENVEKISPWRFAAPLAPSLAARAEGRSLDCAALFAQGRAFLRQDADLLLIEGVGGVMVPLDANNTVLDWVVALGAPTVLVVGDYLGTISHTLTAVEVLRMRGVELAAIVVSQGLANEPFSYAPSEIAHRIAPLPVLRLPYAAQGESLAGLVRNKG
ncbi:dethiobiotin synthase [uncultured Rhodoblastus sp.]|uniref:dethiobiotin synthase n=1 Tax=uncultured Rhodoblastus sp. TaxID=543037 RepID=UPI0025EFE044|nr:dethiobiotin synthase [uncultured Rhodoblastus sp.]